MSNVDSLGDDTNMRAQSESLSFGLDVLWASNFSSRLSAITKKLLLNAVTDYGDWTYSFNHDLRLELRKAIMNDSSKYVAGRPNARDLDFTN